MHGIIVEKNLMSVKRFLEEFVNIQTVSIKISLITCMIVVATILWPSQPCHCSLAKSFSSVRILGTPYYEYRLSPASIPPQGQALPLSLTFSQQWLVQATLACRGRVGVWVKQHSFYYLHPLTHIAWHFPTPKWTFLQNSDFRKASCGSQCFQSVW